MANDGVNVTFTSHIDAFYDEFDPAVRKALEEIGIEAEAHAKEIMRDMSPKPPIDTGYLRNSVTWAIGGGNPNAKNYKADKENKQGIIREGSYSGTAPKKDQPCVYLGTNVEYAPPVEFGTSKMPARAFIRPAVEDFGDEYKEIVENNLGKIK